MTGTESLECQNRRKLLRWLVAAYSAGLCGSAQARLLDYDLSAVEIAARTWAVFGSTQYFNLDNGGNIVNVAFIEVPDGVVVVDTGPSKRYGDALLALIERTVPGKPIVRVFNTHHHPDHFLGNQVFDPSIIAASDLITSNIESEGNGFTDNLYRLLGDWMRGTQVVAPGRILSTATEDVAGRRFSYFYLAGHTSSDLVIRDDETGVLFCGDLAFLYRAPTTPHADIGLWREALATLAGLDRSIILPGHGPVDERSESLDQTDDYLAWLDGSLREAVSTGLTMNEAMELTIPERFSGLGVVRSEFERSVVHLYPDLEDELFERARTR